MGVGIDLIRGFITVKISVVGLGKIGLPLAVQYASRGHNVLGADIDSRVVDLVNSGVEPFPGEYLLAEKLAEAVAAGRSSPLPWDTARDLALGRQAVTTGRPMMSSPVMSAIRVMPMAAIHGRTRSRVRAGMTARWVPCV